jgi:3'-phosphoadenosine 5'-phosphosulfate sulfotransferase (PAPS reductase)/FAD synthetase
MDTYNFVSISGGKDSLATWLHALDTASDPVFPIFSDTGHEHPLTYEYLNYLDDKLGVIQHVKADFSGRIANKREYILNHWAADGVEQSHIDDALSLLQPTGIPFLDLCLWKGRFPSARARFCTQELKVLPLTEYLMNFLSGSSRVFSWQGVRADESKARASLPECEHVGDGLYNYRPILQWSVDDVFQIAKSHGVKPNPLYKLGMSRVGCMPCIHSRKLELRQIALRFPDQVQRVLEWEKLVSSVSKRGCSTFFSEDKTPASFYEGPAAIDVVFEWSKTNHGARSIDPQIDIYSGSACSSVYGLCE